MKKTIIGFFAVFIAILFTACNVLVSTNSTNSSSADSNEMEDDTMLAKLYQIEKGWTEAQVCELLGQPNRQGEMSSVIDVYYMVDSVTEAAIYYWLDQEATVIEIALVDSESGQRTVILK